MKGVILCGVALDFFSKELSRFHGNYLEIGVYDGRLIATLSERFPDRQFYGIDPFIEDGNTSAHNGGIPKGQPLTQQRANAIANLEERSNAKLFVTTSVEFNQQITDAALDEMDISAVLIDGSHHYDDAANDFRLAMRCLKRGGIIFVDDLAIDDVLKACAEFAMREFRRISKWDDGRFWIRPA